MRPGDQRQRDSSLTRGSWIELTACKNELPHLLDVILQKDYKPDRGSIPRFFCSAAVAEKSGKAIVDAFMKHGMDMIHSRSVLQYLKLKRGLTNKMDLTGK